MATKKQELLSSFFERDKLRFRRCLAPGMTCKSSAIQSHSLQNSRVLDLLARAGHVKALGKRIHKEAGPVIRFEDVGRNQATTFTGFCSKHDSEIFKPIDDNAFRPTDSQHLFLTAYRAVAMELHAMMEAVVKIQAGYQDRVRIGLDNGNSPTPGGMLAVEWMYKSYLTHEYKCCFDRALISEQYDGVLYDVIHITHELPAVAVSSLFSIDGISKCDDWVRTTLNVLPLNKHESVAVFGYLPADAALARASLALVLNSTGYQQKYLLSKQILNGCQNFVVSPAHFDKWSAAKRTAITDYFVETLVTGNLDAENELLYLF
jgi:hypothetical protein